MIESDLTYKIGGIVYKKVLYILTLNIVTILYSMSQSFYKYSFFEKINYLCFYYEEYL